MAPSTLRHKFYGVRIFCGYLGWGPGELEAYLENRVLLTSTYPVRTLLSPNLKELWWSRPNNHH